MKTSHHLNWVIQYSICWIVVWVYPYNWIGRYGNIYMPSCIIIIYLVYVIIFVWCRDKGVDPLSYIKMYIDRIRFWSCILPARLASVSSCMDTSILASKMPTHLEPDPKAARLYNASLQSPAMHIRIHSLESARQRLHFVIVKLHYYFFLAL